MYVCMLMHLMSDEMKSISLMMGEYAHGDGMIMRNGLYNQKLKLEPRSQSCAMAGGYLLSATQPPHV